MIKTFLQISFTKLQHFHLHQYLKHCLHDEVHGHLTIHDLGERDANNERVRESGEGEASDGPTIAPFGGASGPEGQNDDDEELRDGVGGDEREVQVKRVDVGSEVEGEERESEVTDEFVNGVALFSAEDFPPPHRAIAKRQGEVQWRHGGHHLISIFPPDHGEIGISCVLLLEN